MIHLLRSTALALFSLGFILTSSAQPIPGWVQQISEDQLKTSLHFLASDDFRGRGSGTPDELAAARYLAGEYQKLDLLPVTTAQNQALEPFFQPFTYLRGVEKHSQNVLAYLEGSNPALKHEVVVLIAHYDHLGVDSKLQGDSIYNGASDDGSGTVALLEIARLIALQKAAGAGPARSILLFHAGAEEDGLQGSAYYVQNPILPLNRIVSTINLDGIGGSDPATGSDSLNYVYLLANDSTSAHLVSTVHSLNAVSPATLKILYPANAARFNSDNKSFEYQLVPSLYFSTGLTRHYHRVTDEPATVDYAHMAKAVKLVAATLWSLASESPTSPYNRESFVKTGEFYCPPCGCDHDKEVFTEPGVCPSCKMHLQPVWKRR